MFRFSARSACFALGAALAGSACGDTGHGATSAAPHDDFGDTIARSAPPRRIVSLSPTATEILFALGVGDRLVGRTRWDTFPDSARRVPSLGDGLRPNVEAVLAARPDLVVLYASDDNRAAAAQLRRAGVQTLAMRDDHVDKFVRLTRRLGEVIGDTVRARIVTDSVTGTLARVRATTVSRSHPRVVWPVWLAPVIVIGGESYLNELLEIAGARNVYADQRVLSPQVAMEDLVRRDPDVVLTSAEGRPRILADPAWRSLRAVREGRVITIDTLLVGRPGPRLGEAAVSIAHALDAVRASRP